MWALAQKQNLLASASQDKTVSVIQGVSNIEVFVRTLSGHEGSVWGVGTETESIGIHVAG